MVAAIGLGTASAASAQSHDGFEFGLRLGASRPGFDSSFTNPGNGRFALATGPVIESGGGFRVRAKDGGALGFSAGYRFLGRAFVEGRFDRASVSFDNSFEPFVFNGPLTDTLNLEAKFVADFPLVDYGRLGLWSANGGLRFGDRFEGEVSFGLTRLPKLRFKIEQRVLIPNFDLSSALIVPLTARAPEDASFGWNAGVGLSYRFAHNAAIGVEGRRFRFAKRTFSWDPPPFAPVRLGPEIIERLNRGPEPVVLDPSFYQFALHLSVRM